VVDAGGAGFAANGHGLVEMESSTGQKNYKKCAHSDQNNEGNSANH
jgi:hypothetical protein